MTKTLSEVLANTARSTIMQTLFDLKGDVTATARMLGRNRTEFYRCCEMYGVDLKAFRAAFGRPRGLRGKAGS